MADPKKPGGSQPQEDPIVSRLMGGGTPTGVISYTGLLAKSAREGHWILHLTLDMGTTVEIKQEDILHTEQLPAERSPFGSLGGTRVFVRKGATVTTTRSVSSTHPAGSHRPDDFDLDIRLGARGARPLVSKAQCFGTEDGTTCAAECGGEGTGDADTCLTCVSCGGTCIHTCNTCRTDCFGATCDTCKTQCGQATCVTCHTCQTKCGQATCAATCQTCQTNCGQATCQTCQTCQTKCNQVTCHTCDTLCKQATCVTCETCHACTHVTCFRGCEPQ